MSRDFRGIWKDENGFIEVFWRDSYYGESNSSWGYGLSNDMM